MASSCPVLLNYNDDVASLQNSSYNGLQDYHEKGLG
jgi:hypothetical protein